MNSSPGWCGSVDLVPACEPKGHQFDSQSGCMPGLQARSPVGGTQIDASLFCSLPSPLSKSKLINLKRKISSSKNTTIFIEYKYIYHLKFPNYQTIVMLIK